MYVNIHTIYTQTFWQLRGALERALTVMPKRARTFPTHNIDVFCATYTSSVRLVQPFSFGRISKTWCLHQCCSHSWRLRHPNKYVTWHTALSAAEQLSNFCMNFSYLFNWSSTEKKKAANKLTALHTDESFITWLTKHGGLPLFFFLQFYCY
jgi:hypothetical protein